MVSVNKSVNKAGVVGSFCCFNDPGNESEGECAPGTGVPGVNIPVETDKIDYPHRNLRTIKPVSDQMAAKLDQSKHMGGVSMISEDFQQYSFSGRGPIEVVDLDLKSEKALLTVVPTLEAEETCQRDNLRAPSASANASTGSMSLLELAAVSSDSSAADYKAEYPERSPNLRRPSCTPIFIELRSSGMKDFEIVPELSEEDPSEVSDAYTLEAESTDMEDLQAPNDMFLVENIITPPNFNDMDTNHSPRSMESTSDDIDELDFTKTIKSGTSVQLSDMKTWSGSSTYAPYNISQGAVHALPNTAATSSTTNSTFKRSNR